MPGKPVQKVSARVAEKAFDNLDFSELTQRYDSDDSISAREAVRRFYWQIMEMRDRGLTYLGICEYLAEILGLELSPNTLKTYLTQLTTTLSTPPKPKSKLRSVRYKASTTDSPEPIAASPPSVQHQEEPQPAIESAPTVASIATILKPAVASTKPAVAKPSATQLPAAGTSQSSGPPSQPSPGAPSGDSSETSIVGFSPEELEAALQIPEPGDKAATEKFLQALQQLKTINPGRWQALKIQAIEEGVNVLGTVMPPTAHLFNQY